jgi:hypothetical protein
MSHEWQPAALIATVASLDTSNVSGHIDNV